MPRRRPSVTALALAALASAAMLAACSLTADLDALTAGSGAAGASGAASGEAGTGGGGSAGTSSAGGPSAGASGSGKAGTSGKAGSGGSEQCDNGKDDDADGKVDCADPDCTDHACVNAPPTGWLGPYLVYGGPEVGAPTCATGAIDLLLPPIMAPPVSCSGCTCGDPFGGTCAKVTLTTFAAAGCAGPSDMQDLAAGMCSPLASGVGNDYFELGAIEATGSTCTASGGVASTKQTVANLARLCPGQSGGCTGTESCLPKPGAPWKAGVCISKKGDVPCDAPGFATKQLAFETLSDTRSCSACSCNAPTARTCQGTVTFFAQNACAGSLGPKPTTGACFSAGGTNSIRLQLTGAPEGGTCTATGGQPQGSAETADPITICCEK